MPDRTINTLKQAGYRAVVAGFVDEYGAVVQPRTVEELMNISAYNITPEDLVRYGVPLDMETFSEFDILIDLKSF